MNWKTLFAAAVLVLIPTVLGGCTNYMRPVTPEELALVHKAIAAIEAVEKCSQDYCRERAYIDEKLGIAHKALYRLNESVSNGSDRL